MPSCDCIVFDFSVFILLVNGLLLNGRFTIARGVVFALYEGSMYIFTEYWHMASIP